MNDSEAPKANEKSDCRIKLEGKGVTVQAVIYQSKERLRAFRLFKEWTSAVITLPTKANRDNNQALDL